jgi:hypothetical protein
MIIDICEVSEQGTPAAPTGRWCRARSEADRRWPLLTQAGMKTLTVTSEEASPELPGRLLVVVTPTTFTCPGFTPVPGMGFG